MYPDAMISFVYGIGAALLAIGAIELISLMTIKAKKWLKSIRAVMAYDIKGSCTPKKEVDLETGK